MWRGQSRTKKMTKIMHCGERWRETEVKETSETFKQRGGVTSDIYRAKPRNVRNERDSKTKTQKWRKERAQSQSYFCTARFIFTLSQEQTSGKDPLAQHLSGLQLILRGSIFFLSLWVWERGVPQGTIVGPLQFSFHMLLPSHTIHRHG